MDDLIHTAGEGVISTIIQCVHEQSLTGIGIFPVLFAYSGSHISLTKTKNTQSVKHSHETLKRVASANAILKHYL